jgi:hypothetical protein
MARRRHLLTDYISRVRQWAKRYPWLAGAIGVAVGAVIVFAVNRALEAGSAAVSRAVRDPLRVSVTYDDNLYAEGFDMALDSRLSQDTAVSTQGSCADVHDWGLEQGAVDVGDTFLRLVVQNNIDETVDIVGMRAEVLNRDNPITQTYVGCPSGGVEDIIFVRFNLDDPNPTALRATATDEGTRPYFRKKHVEVAPDENIVFSVWASACDHLYTWRIAIDVVVHGEERTMMVDLDDEPLQTNGAVPPQEWWTAFPGATSLESEDVDNFFSGC